MITHVKIKGQYFETIDDNGKQIKRAYNNGEFLGNSSEIVVIKDGIYCEVYNEDFKQLSRKHIKMDSFLGASGDTFSILNGNYVETYNSKGKKLSRKVY